ncbi:hypothetical protein NKI20_18335, partial [Mesorhizobium sp. M0830]
MAVDVRWATIEDAAALAAILCEMAEHYRQPRLDADRALSAARKWLGEESPAYPHFAPGRNHESLTCKDGLAVGRVHEGFEALTL